MEPWRNAPNQDEWFYDYTTPPPSRWQRPGTRRLVVIVGVAAVVICAVLGGSALLSGGKSKTPSIPSSLRVVGNNGFDTPATVPVAPTSSTPAPQPKPTAKKTHRAPTKRTVTAPQTPAPPPRPAGVRGRGIVLVRAVAKFDDALQSGTGMLLSSDGDVLTNNHVVRSGTSFTVTVPATGRTYRADVVGTDPSADVAVVHLRHATGLPVATFGNSTDVANAGIHAPVTAVGNANGRGRLRTVHGTVTGLRQSITAQDEGGGNREQLGGLIETNAPTVPGDSGGPLYDSANHVIGMVTAGSVTRKSRDSFAIPIVHARHIANSIVAGRASSRIHIGVPAITGVTVVDAGGRGAYVKGVVPGGPASQVGIGPGSVIVGIDGVRVTSVQSLHALIDRHRPGQRIAVTWVDWIGFGRTAVLTLARGPAD